MEAESFEHPIIGSVRDDEDAHSGRTLGKLAMRARTGEIGVPQRPTNRLKRLGRGRRRGIGRGLVGIPNDREGPNRRKIRVGDQAREIPSQKRLPTDGHDLNVG